jgi:acid phosphatase
VISVSFLFLQSLLNCNNDKQNVPAAQSVPPANIPPPSAQPQRVPLLSKIVVVIGENEKPGSVIGDANAPYINSLATKGSLFVNSFAVEHPSQPNYLDLISGSDQGVYSDNQPPAHFTTSNLADELIKSGKTFASFSEELPFAGFDGASHALYARKHNPIANWIGSGSHQVPSTCSLPFSSFPNDFSKLPDVSFVIPDLCNDGHDTCSPYFDKTKQFDLWLRNNLDGYRQWCVNNNSLLIVTFDEDDNSGDNKISTVFYGARVNPGSYADSITHFNVLRTLEESMNVQSHAGRAASVKPIASCWK